MQTLRRLRYGCLAAALLAPFAGAQVDDLLDDILGDDLVPEAAVQEPAEGDDLLDDFGLDEILGGSDLEVSQGPEPSLFTDWKGFVETRPRSFLSDRGGEKHDEQWLLEAELEVSLRLGEALTGYFRPRIFLDLFDGDLERFAPYEAYVTHAGDGWDLRAGQFVENWGIVDTYNPIDVVSRRDLGTGFLNPERLGEIGFRYRRFLEGGDVIGEPTVSLYALPVWQPTLFPTDDQRFGFGSNALPFDESSGFTPSGSDRGFYAARLAATLTTGPVNADLQMLVADGPDRTPGLFLSGGGLQPAYFGSTTVGMGFRAVPNQDVAGDFLSTLTFKAEAVYKDPRAYSGSPIEEPDDYVAYVLGVDRDFYGLASEQDQLTLTVEYAGERGAADDPIGRFRPFRDDLILRALYQPNDFARSSLEVRGIYDLDSDESIFEAIYGRQLRSVHEDVKLIVQLQTFDPAGDGSSFLDFFPDNTSLAVGLRWAF